MLSKIYQRSALAVALSIVTSLALAGKDNASEMNVDMTNAKGESIGVVKLEDTPNGLLIYGELRGIPVGEHAFHFHETGACDPATGFKSAGGHLAAGHNHGFKTEGGPHPGDMSNFFATDSKMVKLETFNPMVGLANNNKTSLLDGDGSALVIHAGPDDYQSQPSGDAGGRIACGVIGGKK